MKKPFRRNPERLFLPGCGKRRQPEIKDSRRKTGLQKKEPASSRPFMILQASCPEQILLSGSILFSAKRLRFVVLAPLAGFTFRRIFHNRLLCVAGKHFRLLHPSFDPSFCGGTPYPPPAVFLFSLGFRITHISGNASFFFQFFLLFFRYSRIPQNKVYTERGRTGCLDIPGVPPYS